MGLTLLDLHLPCFNFTLRLDVSMAAEKLVSSVSCHFPIGILGQVWYLIVSIPDLCNLITFFDLVLQIVTNFEKNLPFYLNLYAQVVENIFAMTVTGKSSLL